MGRSRSRSPRYRDSGSSRHRRSRSPRSRRSRSPRSRRHRSRSPGGSSRRHRSPPRRDEKYSRREGRDGRGDEPPKPSYDAQALTLGGSMGVQKPTKKKKNKQPSQPTIMPTNPEDMTDEDKLMQQVMGFSQFDSTNGKEVKGNDTYAINRKVQRKYRQYMNRKGGFNRPLDFMPWKKVPCYCLQYPPPHWLKSCSVYLFFVLVAIYCHIAIDFLKNAAWWIMFDVFAISLFNKLKVKHASSVQQRSESIAKKPWWFTVL